MDRSWLKISFIYVATVIGAGFASGREIIEFFAIYGLKGIMGITLSGILFSLLGSMLLLKIHTHQIYGFNDLVIRTFGGKLGRILDIIMIISLYTGFSIMISGSGAIFKEELGLPFNLGIMTMVVLSFIVFLFRLEGFSLISSALVPLLILGIAFTAFYLILNGEHSLWDLYALYEGGTYEGNRPVLMGINKGNFFSSALLYVGSNSLIIITVFSSLFPLIGSKKNALYGGLMGGMILYLLGLFILTTMLLYYPEAAPVDIPMLKISNYIGGAYRRFYAFILWIAIFTTALANGTSFINRFSDHRNKLFVTVIFCLASIPLAKLGFSNLVSLIYPVFGFIGFFTLIYVLVKL